MEISIRESCIRCGRCVKVCPSQIFEQEGAGAPVTLCNPGSCIVCGHCVAVCPTGSVAHEAFPPERVHAADYAALPTPEQVELLMAVRRSDLCFITIICASLRRRTAPRRPATPGSWAIRW